MNRIIFLLILISLVSPVKSQRIQKSTNGLYGLAVSKTDGNVKWLVKPKFSKMEKNYDDSFSVCDEYGKWGVISSVGKSVVKCKYSSKGSAIEEYQNTFASDSRYSLSNVGEKERMSKNYSDVTEEVKIMGNSQKFKVCLEAAMNGDPEGMYWTAYSYMQGNGVQQNDNLAFEWMSKAAAKDFGEAQALLSGMYAVGIGVEQNDKSAFEWACKAAKNSSPMGYAIVGECYKDGVGVKVDKERAFECMKAAAEMGYTDAYSALSNMYRKGDGTKIDKNEAFRWAKMGAQDGDPVCQSWLAIYYSEGIGTTKNLSEAERWAAKSIEQSTEYGGYAFAYIYKDGPKKDTKKALDYVNRGINEFKESENRVNADFKDWEGLLDLLALKGYIYLADNQYENARKTADEIVQISPDYNDEIAKPLMDFYYGRNNGESNIANMPNNEIYSDIDSNIPVNKIKNDNTFAIIIGNEHYDDVVNVEFANRDAESFSNYCEKILGIPTNNIRKYIDATYGKMVAALEDISEIAKAYNGDINIIFYYAGHGIPNERDFSSYLLPVDGSGKSTNLCLSLNTLYDTLAQTEANRIMVFLDACFSGSVRGNGMLASARGVAIKAQPEEPRENMVIFAASSDDETAYPYKEQGHGLFTYYLLKKLQSSKGNLTLSELSSYINENVRKQSVVINKKSQTPTTMGSLDMNTNWFTK